MSFTCNRAIAALVAGVFSLMAPSASCQNLVTNGDFETASFNEGCTAECFASCNFFLGAWSRGPSIISTDLDRNVTTGCGPYLPTGGLYRISLQGSVCCGCDNNGWIQQSVSLVAGRTYRLRFDALLDAYDSLRVQCGGQTWQVAPTSSGSPAWLTHLFDFRCTNAQAPIRFESMGDPGAPDCLGATYMFLDNISLTEIEPTSCERRVPEDFTTIQAAIDSIPQGLKCTVQIGPGLWSGPIDLQGKDVALVGAGPGVTIIAGSGPGSASVVTFSGGEPSTAGVENLTIRGGTSGTPFPGSPQYLCGGGVFSYNSAAYLKGCAVESNTSSFGGGGYFWNSAGVIEDCTFTNNDAGADGGGLQFYGGTPTVRGTFIAHNHANSRGGGAHVVAAQAQFESTIFQENTCANLAGALSWAPAGASGALLALDACTLSSNTAGVAQGGIGVLADGPSVKLQLLDTQVCGNAPLPNIAGLWTDLGGNHVCVCTGDLNLNGGVDGTDLGILLSQWGASTPSTTADLNNDGSVDGSDLGVLLGAWGPCL